MYVLIRHTIYECLVEIQHIRIKSLQLSEKIPRNATKSRCILLLAVTSDLSIHMKLKNMNFF